MALRHFGFAVNEKPEEMERSWLLLPCPFLLSLMKGLHINEGENHKGQELQTPLPLWIAQGPFGVGFCHCWDWFLLWFPRLVIDFSSFCRVWCGGCGKMAQKSRWLFPGFLQIVSCAV